MMPLDPVVGSTTLRRPAVQSPNFSAGTAGWIIRADGSVEFNTGVFRGAITGATLVIDGPTGGVFVYSGTPASGNLIGSWAGMAGSDSFGNAYPQGLNVTTGTITGTSITGGTITGTTISGGTVSGSTISGTTFNGTDFVLSTAGAFFYSGVPATGNLIASISNFAGTDSHGNGYIQGISNYQNVGGVVSTVNTVNSTIWFYTGTVANPGTTQQGWLGFAGGSGLEIVSGTGTTPFVVSAPMEIASQLSVPAQTLGAPNLYGDSLGGLAYVHGGDAQAYRTGQIITFGNSGQLINSTSPAVISGMQMTVTSGFKYHMEGWVNYTGTGAVGFPQFGFDGSSTTSHIDGKNRFITPGAPSVEDVGIFNGSAGLQSGPTLSGGHQRYEFDMWVQVSGSGAFNVRAQEGVGGDSFTVDSAYMRMEMYS